MRATIEKEPLWFLRKTIRPTTVITSPRLSERLGMDVTIVSESFQFTGSFKFRAAYHLAASVRKAHLIAASSGNFGQALAYACSLLGKTCTIVMPIHSARVKIDAVRGYGGGIDLIDTRQISREKRIADLGNEFPDAYVTDAYDDPFIIDGNSSLGEEILELDKVFDHVIVPIGGGGLSSGIVSAFRRHGCAIAVVGAEPLLANDAAKSLKAGYVVRNEEEPLTIADGARTVSLGKCNWVILKDVLQSIVEVSEENIAEGVRLLFQLANLKVEPTGALAIGAVLENPAKYHGGSVCCVVSGGNVDAEVFTRILG